jgi:excisionase family DNA binding protein
VPVNRSLDCTGDELENLLSVEEAARRLGGISKHTINSWLSKGILMRTKIGSRTFIRESELQRVVRDGAKSPSPRKLEGRV